MYIFLFFERWKYECEFFECMCINFVCRTNKIFAFQFNHDHIHMLTNTFAFFGTHREEKLVKLSQIGAKSIHLYTTINKFTIQMYYFHANLLNFNRFLFSVIQFVAVEPLQKSNTDKPNKFECLCRCIFCSLKLFTFGIGSTSNTYLEVIHTKQSVKKVPVKCGSKLS